MNPATAAASPATAAIGSARVIVLVSVLGLAGVVGLAAGTALNERSAQGQTINGYPPGWHGGAAVPVNRAATSTFSIEALDAVRATRGDAAAPATRAEESDYFQRHPQLTGPSRTRIPANAE